MADDPASGNAVAGMIPPPPAGTPVVAPTAPADPETPVVVAPARADAPVPNPPQSNPPPSDSLPSASLPSNSATIRFSPPPPPPAPPAAITGPVVLSHAEPAAPKSAASAVGSSPVAARATPVLRLPDGERIVLDAAVALGRRPSAPERASDAREVAVDDPAKSVSKTHALLRPVADGIELHDLHSTNGTSYGGDDDPVTLDPGASALIAAPVSVWLGRLRLEVE